MMLIQPAFGSLSSFGIVGAGCWRCCDAAGTALVLLPPTLLLLRQQLLLWRCCCCSGAGAAGGDGSIDTRGSTHTHAHARTRTHTHAPTHTHTHPRTRTLTPAQARMHTHARTHARRQAGRQARLGRELLLLLGVRLLYRDVEPPALPSHSVIRVMRCRVSVSRQPSHVDRADSALPCPRPPLRCGACGGCSAAEARCCCGAA